MLRPRKVERPNKPKPKKKAEKKRAQPEIIAPDGWFDDAKGDPFVGVDWGTVPRGVFGVDPGDFVAIRLDPVQTRPPPDRRKKANKKKANKNGRVYTKAAQKSAVKKPRESTRERRDRKIAEATAEPPTSFVVAAEKIQPGDLIIGMPGGRTVSKVRVGRSGVTVYHEGRRDSEALYFALGSLWTVRRDG